MKVVLMQDVKGLGGKGAVVEVAEGYARNFLLPRKLAVPASEGLLRELAQQQEAKKIKKERLLQEARELARRLGEMEVVIAARAGESGKLFGSVTTREIAEVLQKKYGIVVERKQLELKETIKEVGVYRVQARLAEGVVANFSLRVIPG